MGELTGEARLSLLACEEGCDPIKDRLRGSIRTIIEAVLEEKLDALAIVTAATGHQQPRCHQVSVPGARLLDGESSRREWRSKALECYQTSVLDKVRGE